VALHNACSYGHYDVVKVCFPCACSHAAHVVVRCVVSVLQYLVSVGASVNATDLWRYTPLHEAAIKGKSEIVRLLLENHADVNLRNCDGKRPVDVVPEEFEDVTDVLRGDAALLEAARMGQLDRVRTYK
jgi:tankyrase